MAARAWRAARAFLSFAEMKEPAHRALHPFGQIPTDEEGDFALFEAGSIVVYIAKRHAGLLPDDPAARARAISWMFAAVNTVEPPILELATARLQRLTPARLLDGHPKLFDRLLRAEGRPADQRAFAAQLAVFAGSRSSG